MMIEQINIGGAANDGTGDPIRTAFGKINAGMAVALAAAPLSNFEAVLPPTAADDASAGYSVGSTWLMPARGLMWRCIDPTVGAARWVPLGNADHPGYRGNVWYGAPILATDNVTQVAGNTLYAIPVAFKFRRLVTHLAVFIAVGSPGVTCRLGIYAHDPVTRLPGALIVEGPADLSAETGPAVVVSTFAAPPDLVPGVYWLASCWSGAATPSKVPASANSGGMSFAWGHANAQGALDTAAAQATTRYTRTAELTYQAGAPFFPAEFGAGSFGTNAPGSPLIAWRCE